MITRRTVLALAGLAVGGVTGCAEQPATVAAPDVPVRLRTRWQGRPDGPLPPRGDEGVPFTLALSESSASPTVTGGALVGNLPDRHAAAYVMQQLDAKVRRIGATFGVGPGTDAGSLALVAWVPGRATLETHCHVVVTPTRWIVATAENNALDELASGTLSRPLPQDGTPQRVEVVFDGATAFLTLPDGSSHQITGEAIGRIPGAIAGWEFYRDHAGGADVRLYETWAG
ncbi:MAG: hypothetical protein ABW212_03925 [Pseudonocardia sediminis]